MKSWRAPAFIELPHGSDLFHVYRPPRGATEFNKHLEPTDSWRFSPFADAHGTPVPSWYGAMTAEGALYETVFRDVVAKRRPSIDRATVLAGRMIARLTLTSPLKVIQLYGDGLMKLLLKTSFTTSEPRSYSRSRHIARSLHNQFSDAHGFIWLSRMNNQEMSVVLYEDRTPAGFASPTHAHALDSGPGLVAVMTAANRIGCAVN